MEKGGQGMITAVFHLMNPTFCGHFRLLNEPSISGSFSGLCERRRGKLPVLAFVALQLCAKQGPGLHQYMHSTTVVGITKVSPCIKSSMEGVAVCTNLLPSARYGPRLQGIKLGGGGLGGYSSPGWVGGQKSRTRHV